MTLSYIPSDTNDEGILKATASGVLPNGKPVVVNADGTVSVPSSGFGSAVVFNAANSDWINASFDSSSNKVVVSYTDYGNSGYGTAIVGTVSGTSISFGSPVVFNSGTSTYLCSTFDSNSNKVVIAYMDNSNSEYGTAIVGTVSGTSISFGSEVVFETNRAKDIGITFDSNSNKVVIAYAAELNSFYGTAIVGTVSGTSISFGSKVVYESARSDANAISFDSNQNKVVVSYSDIGNSEYGTAIVGTVSGTSISFGTAVVFESDRTDATNSAFDSSANKTVIFYRDIANSTYGTAIVGTISGTSISFGTPAVFSTSNTFRISSDFDSSTNQVVVSYRDVGGSTGSVVTGTVSGTSITFGPSKNFRDASIGYNGLVFDSNAEKSVIAFDGDSGHGNTRTFDASASSLTASNYIGISTGGTYADGSNATVKIIGNTSDEQSGLTAGQAYYVQTDGTIGTTPADPSVFAGTAISATKMLVKT